MIRDAKVRKESETYKLLRRKCKDKTLGCGNIHTGKCPFFTCRDFLPWFRENPTKPTPLYGRHNNVSRKEIHHSKLTKNKQRETNKTNKQELLTT